jgi:hypothetical protein
LTSSTSFGTDYTRYHHPKPADLLNLNFGKARRRKLQKALETLLTSGWWREGRFDLRAAEEQDATTPTLKEQLKLLKIRRAQLFRTTADAEARIIQYKWYATINDCLHVYQAVLVHLPKNLKF